MTATPPEIFSASEPTFEPAPVAELGPRATARAARARARFAEFLAVGGSTLILFPLAWLLRRSVGMGASEFAVGFATFYGAYVINDPHFAVTYVLFYKDARKRAFARDVKLTHRARYLFAGAVVPAALVAWASLALLQHSASSLGWMIQLMFLLVGWHYVKQGFGVLAVLSARRGTPLSPRTRRVALAHGYAAWAYAFADPPSAAGEFEEKGVVYQALAHPRWLASASGALLAVSTVALGAALAADWRRDRRSVPAAPFLVFFITLWAWTVYSSADPLVRYLIPALHSIQYLYFVGLMKRNEAVEAEGPPRFGRPVGVRLAALGASALALGWLLFRGAPTLLDGAGVWASPRAGGPGGLGETPFFAVFYVVVNLHHYVMDFVIWRRDNPDTRYLRSSVVDSLGAERRP